VSLRVHAFPSSHLVPSAFGGFVQAPVVGSQIPTSWHWSCAAQTTGDEPSQMPDWQVSVWEHASPSSQVVPSDFVGFEQIPVSVLQLPAP